MTTKKNPLAEKSKTAGNTKKSEVFEAVGKAVDVQIPDTDSAKGFPIVGIGASAGGLAAFEAFFSGMPVDVDPEMAFVLVQHLAPDHKSILVELIRRYTRMEVFEVEDGMVVRPNCTYIIPPNRDMAFMHGALQLMEPASPRGQRLPIDFFFRSLAQDQHERAIGIILSGTGSDGTQGVRAIKGEGGMAMAQTPDSTEYDGMPRSAIATGQVDYELPPAEMAGRLIAYTAHAFGGGFAQSATLPEPKADSVMMKIFVLLRSKTGHDFSQYKPSTIHRRIERRMTVHQIDTLAGYVKYLQQTPAEVELLFRDLLIGVTNFFRDPAAFLALEEHVVPKLFAGQAIGSVIRVWVPGCSTGEEAYSIAILLQEYMEAQQQSYTVQVFATDIDSQAIATARLGLYSAGIASDISPERLARFFTTEAGGFYRIHKVIRDMVIFSEQDVIKDPPFSKLRLVSCRNLMIYMNGNLQKQLIPLFHYALSPGGMLFLGSSETVGEHDNLFTVQDRKSKLYRRKEDFPGVSRASMVSFLSPMSATGASIHPQAPARLAFPVKLPLRELTEQALLQQVVPAGALVNGQGDILYLHGRTGMFLELVPGESGINNILKMAREGLRPDLSTALHKAVTSQEIVCHHGLHVKTNGHFSLVDLTVRPVAPGTAVAQETPLYLVILEEVSAADPAVLDPSAAASGSLPPDVDASIQALRQELRAKGEYLQVANEELETSNEELKSSNEELQSVNEELQSTNEELETSKEELQSLNEELATVNTELQNKLADLSRANGDMNNLLAGTGIGTVFIDHQLRILRFTPMATQIINLIAGDIGRPVSHIVSNLVGYTSLVADVKTVLATLIPKEVEVQTTEGIWYAMRIHPYRTLSNVIEGAVITFVDITEIRRLAASLQKANDQLRLAVVVRDAHDAITVQDLEGRILAWNPGAVRMYGWSEDEALAMNVRDRIPKELRKDALAKIHLLSQAEILESYRTQRLAKNGTAVEVSIISTALVNEAGDVYAVATTERGIGIAN